MQARWTLLGLVLVGCGSSDDAKPVDAPAVTCSGAGVCLDAPATGFQVKSGGVTIEPGEDAEYCEILALPGGPDDLYHVNRFESAMTAGSHHLIVTAIEVGSPTESAVAVGDRLACFSAEQVGDDLKSVTGAQVPYHVEDFPEGVGRVYQGGQLVIFDYHYLNASPEPLLAQAAVNFHVVDPSQVQKIARSFGFYNFGIEIPPGQEASFKQSCSFSEDVVVAKLTRHTHRWGTDFSVWFDGTDRDGEHIFTSTHYEDTDFPFEEPITMPAGSGFEFECSYENTESHALGFGVKATDEMCILFGTWWGAGSEDVPSQGCKKF